MTEPVTTSMITYFSLTKIWGIFAGVCGAIIPILALADKKHITIANAFFMAITGSSFSIFVGPALSQKLGFTSIEATIALAWAMGATGVFVYRAFLEWLEKRGVSTLDKLVDKFIGDSPTNNDISNNESTK